MHSRHALIEDDAAAGDAVGASLLRSSLDESSELVRLRDQMERLKGEMMQQSMASEESLKQERFEWTEKMKQMETQHAHEMESTREGQTLHCRRRSVL